MKKVKKFFLTLLILILLGGAVFLQGWVQLRVPVESYGVLASKTGGVHPEPIVGGAFEWTWEALVPTNAKVYTFSAKPRTCSVHRTGTLPSARLYATMMDGNPDFTYSFDVEATLSVKPENLPALVRSGLAFSETDYAELLEQKAEAIAGVVIQEILAKAEAAPEKAVHIMADTQSLIQTLSSMGTFKDIEIASVTVRNYSIPDIELYTTAKDTYLHYQKTVSERLKVVAEEKAVAAVNSFFDFEGLEKLGDLFSKHPELLEYYTALADKGVYYFKP